MQSSNPPWTFSALERSIESCRGSGHGSTRNPQSATPLRSQQSSVTPLGNQERASYHRPIDDRVARSIDLLIDSSIESMIDRFI